MIHVAFTGTRRGMTAMQHTHLVRHLFDLGDEHRGCVLHHGDCVGADEEAHQHAIWMCDGVVIHPPTDERLRARCHERLSRWATVKVRDPLSYLERNQAMVDECARLVACPAKMEEQRRGGTWSTIRYAKRRRKPVLVILPDGSEVATG